MDRHDCASYDLSLGNTKEAIDTFEKAIKGLPKCLILYLSYADMLETLKNFPVISSEFSRNFLGIFKLKIQEVKAVYEKCVEQLDEPLAYIQYMKFLARTEVNFNFLFRKYSTPL
jgi:tetratricopeptide (TPR) repeat protein